MDYNGLWNVQICGHHGYDEAMLETHIGREEAAAAKKVSVRTVDRWLRLGFVPYIRFRSLVLIEREPFSRFVPPKEKRSRSSTSRN